MSRVLGTAGHHVVEAGGAAQALALCREHAPDVLVVDLAMCERDRLAVLDAVKADAEVFRTAVVVVVAADLGLDAVRAQLRRGAQDVLLAPVRDADLLARVQASGRTKILQEELVDQTRRIEQHLYEDPLTRIHNRRFLFSHLRALVSGARRHDRPLSVAMVDLDGFKGVNDRRGHAVGDAMLVAVARALRGGLRKEDAVGRLGGEEFLALLPDTGALGGHARGRAPARGGGRGGRPGARHGERRLGHAGARRGRRRPGPAGRRRALRGQGGGPQLRPWRRRGTC